MKLLLTSAGLSTGPVRQALLELTDRRASDLKAAVIPTAANVIEGDKGWLIQNFVDLQRAGLGGVDLVDISALPAALWLPRLVAADVLVFTGGDTTHLIRWLRRSGLAERLAALLRTRVYLGISAGSMVAGPHLGLSQSQKTEPGDHEGLGLVDFLVQPHLDSPYFPMAASAHVRDVAGQYANAIYGLDDAAAVVVDGSSVTVVGDGATLVIPSNR